MVLFASRDARTLSLRRASWRLRALMLVFLMGFASIGLRLVDLTTGDGTPPKARVLALTDAARARADIIDRNGVVLATNIRVRSAYAEPPLVNDPARTARALAGLLDVDEATLRERLMRRDTRFVWVKRRISPAEEAALRQLGLPGIWFREEEQRVYPQMNLASHVLGYTGTDWYGHEGLERAMQARLAEDPEPLALALDVRAQGLVREATREAVERFHAKGACSLVFDVVTRDFLAFVSLPDYDPNARPDPKTRPRNRCSNSVYELGSMFKTFTAAMALDSGAVSLFERFDASEPLRIGRHRIRDDHGKYRWLSVPEVFAFSSNIGTTLMNEKAGGVERQQPFLQSLGLFERPRIELLEAERPILPGRWPAITQATVSYGHGIAVTPVAFVEAVAALVDDGRFKEGTLLLRDTVPEGPRVVGPETVDTLRWLLWLAVDRGTGDQAKSGRYLVGGKTGTADKPIYGEGYREGAVVASFFGVFPVEDPRYVVLVTLDEPQGTEETFGYRYGGWTAAPVVGEIIDRLGPVMGVPPSPPAARAAMEARLEIVPAMNGRTHDVEEGFAAVRPH